MPQAQYQSKNLNHLGLKWSNDTGHLVKHNSATSNEVHNGNAKTLFSGIQTQSWKTVY